MHPHAHAQLHTLRPGVGGEGLLGEGCGGGRVTGALEDDEVRVPLGVDLDASVSCHGLAEEPAMLREQVPVGVAELVQEPGRALDVGEQQRDRARRERRTCRPGELQRGVLVENRPLEALQLRARVDAELLDQDPAPLLIGLERLGLASRAVERDHQLPARPLAQRILGDKRLELADDLRVSPQREIGLDALLDRREAQLLEPRDRRLGEVVVGEVPERRTAPQVERLAKQRRPTLRVPRGAGTRPVLHEPLEAT